MIDEFASDEFKSKNGQRVYTWNNFVHGKGAVRESITVSHEVEQKILKLRFGEKLDNLDKFCMDNKQIASFMNMPRKVVAIICRSFYRFMNGLTVKNLHVPEDNNPKRYSFYKKFVPVEYHKKWKAEWRSESFTYSLATTIDESELAEEQVGDKLKELMLLYNDNLDPKVYMDKLIKTLPFRVERIEKNNHNGPLKQAKLDMGNFRALVKQRMRQEIEREQKELVL